MDLKKDTAVLIAILSFIVVSISGQIIIIEDLNGRTEGGARRPSLPSSTLADQSPTYSFLTKDVSKLQEPPVGSLASQPSGNFAIPTALRRPNPFLQRLPSAAADQEALFQSKASQTQSQTGVQPTNQPSYQNGQQQSGGNQPMFPNQPDPYQTGSYQGPYNSMNSNNNNPPTMAGPVPADRISYQPAPTNTVQSGYQQPIPGQQSMQVPNNPGPSYDVQNQYPPQQNVYAQPEPQYQYQSQYPQYNQPMTLNSPAGPVQTPGFNDPNGKGYDAYGQPSYPPYEQQPQTQPGAYQQPQTQPGAYQQPQTQPGAYQEPQAQTGTYQQPQTQPGAYQQPQTQPGAYQQPQTQPGAYQQPQSQPGAYQQPQTQSGSYQQQQSQPGAYHEPQTQPGAYQQPQTQPGEYQQPQNGGYQPTYVDPNQQYQTQQQAQPQYSQYQQPANPAPPTQTYVDPSVPIPRVPGQQQPYDPQAQGQGVPATAPAPGQPPVPAQYSGYPPQNPQGYPPQTQYYDPSQPQQQQQQPYYGAPGQPQQVQYVQQPGAYQPQQPGAYPGQAQQGAAYPQQQQPGYQQQYQAQPPAQPGYPPQQPPQQQAYQQPGYPPQSGYPPQQPQGNGYPPQQPGYQQQQPQQGPYQFSSPAAKFPANNPYNQQQSVQYPQSGQSYTPPRTQQPQNQAPMSGKIQELLTKIRQAQSHSTSPTKTVEEKNKWNAIFRKLWDIYLFWSNMKQSNKQTNSRGMVTA